MSEFSLSIFTELVLFFTVTRFFCLSFFEVADEVVAMPLRKKKKRKQKNRKFVETKENRKKDGVVCMNKCKNKLIKIHDMENFNKECKGQKLHAKKNNKALEGLPKAWKGQ